MESVKWAGVKSWWAGRAMNTAEGTSPLLKCPNAAFAWSVPFLLLWYKKFVLLSTCMCRYILLPSFLEGIHGTNLLEVLSPQVPCGHLCACEICAKQQRLNCPVCTQPTQSTLKIFLSWIWERLDVCFYSIQIDHVWFPCALHSLVYKSVKESFSPTSPEWGERWVSDAHLVQKYYINISQLKYTFCNKQILGGHTYL
jgi:hypothetical protein